MKVGCVKEIKNNEFRVGMTPDNVKSYVNAGHDVYIEKGAGEGKRRKGAEKSTLHGWQHLSAAGWPWQVQHI